MNYLLAVILAALLAGSMLLDGPPEIDAIRATADSVEDLGK